MKWYILAKQIEYCAQVSFPNLNCHVLQQNTINKKKSSPGIIPEQLKYQTKNFEIKFKLFLY